MAIEKPMGRWTAVLALTLAAWLAAGADAAELDHRREYRDCMDLARREPDAAYETARHWQALGGGEAALHCVATALFGLGQKAEAARRLESLAEASRQEADVRAGILAQAAQAWLADGDAGRAQAVLAAALKLAPDDASLFVDRAVALAALALYEDAAQDLSRAIELDPGDVEAWVLRAAARRHLDEPGPATADVEAALRLAPDHPDALLERGLLKRRAGDNAGARADWIKVLAVAPGSDAADAARAQLEAMDVKVK